MNFFGLSFLVWLPFVAGLFLLARSQAHGRLIALLTAAAALLRVAGFVISFKPDAGFQSIERYDWLRSIGLEYHLALDGISLAFVLLCVFVFSLGLLACRPGEFDSPFYGLVLLLMSGLLGTFTAQNFLHFFFHWELSLIPAFFLVKLYGGTNRNFAALQFFLYTMLGSIAMLLAFLALGLRAGTLEIASLRPEGAHLKLLFWLAFLGVAVKVPIWPLHSWLPGTYTEAPPPVTMMLSGVMSKMGVYALIRLILPVFPKQISQYHQPLLAVAVITVLYGAWAAFAQRDLKRLFAYSSLSHLGYCFLGVFAVAKAAEAGMGNERAAAINGVILQVLSHGVLAAALFAFVGFLEHRAGGRRALEEFGGLRKQVPVFAGLMGIAIFASLGLPGLSGFPAEFLIFKGAFSFAPVACGFAVLGLLLTAVYLLTAFGRVFLGPLNDNRTRTMEIRLAERSVVIPAIVAAFVLGIAPQLVIGLFNPAVTALVQKLQ